MRDILPDKMILRQHVIGVIQQVFERFGFEPLQTPAVELEETLMGKYGPDAERLIYHVSHPGGREQLCLRYDLTVPLCRVVGQYPTLNKPFKRYQIAPVWRAERPQKGRYREFYQCDADIVGSASMLADAEILNVIYEVLRRLNFQRFTMNINNRKLLVGIGQFAGVPDELLGGLYRSIDKLDRIGLEGVAQELRDNNIPEAAISRLLQLLQISGDNHQILTGLRHTLRDFPIAQEGLAELEEITHYLEALEIPERFYQIIPSMVRGLDYYTGPIYETVVEEPHIGSITGGGRYDELVGLFTGHSLPVTGTTIGIERIIDVMDELKMYPSEIRTTVTEVLVTRFDANLVSESLRAARDLRQAGLNCELYFEDAPLGNQIRYALRKGISYVAVIGPDEVAAGQITIRNLDRREEMTVPRDEAASQIMRWREIKKPAPTPGPDPRQG